MAKITTVIDIGSNSMRMVVFKKTSRFAFHLINETKLKVKISEGCYENDGNLQDIPMQRAFDALKSFLSIANNLKSRKILCVATSALRDAPNKKIFVNKVLKELKLNIKIIDGQKEAYLGGISALNLLDYKDFATIDIGGGSTELSFVKDKKIIDTISLKIGTVRLKELFFNKNDLEGAKEYIVSLLESNKEFFYTHNLLFQNFVGLGGTARSLSRIIMDREQYCFNVLHGFEYDFKTYSKLFNKLVDAKDTKSLKELSVKKDRYDTIQEGTFIFKTICEYFNVKNIITSGVGVREGLYITDLLRTTNHKFPNNFNVSLKSLIDRFVDDDKQTAYLGNNVRKIFDILQPIHKLDDKYCTILVIASKLQLIGLSLNFYKNSEHSFNFILNGLSYGFTHQNRVLIAHIIKFSKKSLPKKTDIEKYSVLLPKLDIVQWLSFMMSLNSSLNNDFSKTKFEYNLEGKILNIKSDKSAYIKTQILEKIQIPQPLEVKLI